MEKVDSHCYCGQLDPAQPAGTFQCTLCHRRFHAECLQSPVQSPLRGDTLYSFTCSGCGTHNEEKYERAKVSWLQVVMLTLYNLQLSGGGKCGYFRWKEHVCGFIDKNWTVFFGSQKKKTTLWHGTVAGTLSSNCPQKFLSGTKELGEPGWWKLTEMSPPLVTVGASSKSGPRGSRSSMEVAAMTAQVQEEGSEPKRPRRSRPFSLSAAMELKAKRQAVTEHTRSKRSGPSAASMSDTGETPTVTADVHLTGQSHLTHSAFDSSTSHTALEEPSASLSSTEDSWQSDSRLLSGSGSHLNVGDNMWEAGPAEGSNLSASYLSSPASSLADLTGDEDSQASFAASDHSFSVHSLQVSRNQHLVSLTAGSLLGDGEDEADENFEIDPGTMSLSTDCSVHDLTRSPVMEELLLGIADSAKQESRDSDSCPSEGEEGQEEEEEDVTSEEEEGVSEGGEEMMDGKRPVRRRQRRKPHQPLQEETAIAQSSLRPLTLYDKLVLLKRLSATSEVKVHEDGQPELPEWKAQQLTQARNRLRRKLLVNKAKWENGLEEFDLDTHMTQLATKYWGSLPLSQELEGLNTFGAPITRHPNGYVHTLDRFMAKHGQADFSDFHVSFRTRLVGFEDDQLQPITSPYTMRILKPFIRRDFESEPLRVKLLQEIVAFPHRNDPNWQPTPRAPIDYCYVRPQHIPSVNSLCSTFFWPGIDLSECLQYPDFSCVVLYKKIVVAFAFMVPDVKHSEAYISFIFTHPEWRNAGIASFMLYHLIQTCMGKDVTLHVSATNPAMLLYQKFGFKAEELCLDFYDKYFPVSSRECRHAFFLRLRR